MAQISILLIAWLADSTRLHLPYPLHESLPQPGAGRRWTYPLVLNTCFQLVRELPDVGCERAEGCIQGRKAIVLRLVSWIHTGRSQKQCATMTILGAQKVIYVEETSVRSKSSNHRCGETVL